ncbi:MAG TPA: carbon monoxide dehydrogenase subunit G [Alphaproteobacteria bacterium]|nr:carbon monoxide dehydrogenase subunit G [Alphaproteobacteria bacterium]
MEMSGEYRISAPRARVWEALNDADILKQCIPGCESIEKISPTEFSAKVVAKVGPVKATFTGEVKLSDLVPPKSYKISGEGKGGAAGFAKGGAAVTLEEAGAETVLRYTAQGNVGGKLAQIGSRLIDGTARKLADEFFGKFAATVGGAPAEAAATSAEASAALAAEPSARPEHIAGLPPVVWIGGVVLLIFLLLIIFAL